MRQLLLSSMVWTIFVIFVSANDATESRPLYERKRHSVRLGIGLMPIDHFKSFNFFGVDNTKSGSGSLGEKYFENRFGTSTKTFRPVNLMSYTYDVNKWLQFGVFVAYHNADNITRDARTGEFYYNQFYHQASVIPSIRCAWYRTEIMQVYSSVGLGIGVLSKGYIDSEINERRIDTVIAGQIIILGIAIGRELYGFLNLYGGGSIGFSSMGIGYRF